MSRPALIFKLTSVRKRIQICVSFLSHDGVFIEVLWAVGGFFVQNLTFHFLLLKQAMRKTFAVLVYVTYLSVSPYKHRRVPSTSPTLHATHATLEINQGRTREKEDKEDVISYLSLLMSLWLSLGFLPASRALGAFGESWWYLERDGGEEKEKESSWCLVHNYMEIPGMVTHSADAISCAGFNPCSPAGELECDRAD